MGISAKWDVLEDCLIIVKKSIPNLEGIVKQIDDKKKEKVAAVDLKHYATASQFRDEEEVLWTQARECIKEFLKDNPAIMA